MRLNPAAFDAFLAGNIGQSFMWAKAYICPCVTASSGAANPTCKICFARGRFWPTSVPAIAGVASQKVQQNWAQMGLYQLGDSVLSIPQISPMYDAGQFDRILALNASEEFSLNLQQGQDRILSTVVSISRVFWLNQGLTQTIDGEIPEFDANGNLTWPDGGGPPDGQTYSVSGVRRQEFFVFREYPANRNEHFGARLPKRLVARVFDLFGR